MKKLFVHLSLLLLLAALLIPMAGCKKEEPEMVEETPATETPAADATMAPASTDMAATDSMSTEATSTESSDAAPKQ
jgi:hypothetical protein